MKCKDQGCDFFALYLCANGACTWHCDDLGGECELHANVERPTLPELTGLADARLTGVTVFRRDVRARERGGAHWREELEREVALWSERQLEELQAVLARRPSGLLFDAEEAAEIVGDKTSVQCARLLFLLERAAVPEEGEAEEAEEDEQAEAEAEGVEGADAAPEDPGEENRENAELYRRGVKRYLAEVITLCLARRRKVCDEDVREAVEQLKQRRVL